MKKTRKRAEVEELMANYLLLRRLDPAAGRHFEGLVKRLGKEQRTSIPHDELHRTQWPRPKRGKP